MEQYAFTPHLGQKEILNSPERFIVMACGRRWGKTTLVIHKLILEALFNERSGNYWYIAPTYRQAKEIAWRILKQVWYSLPAEARGNSNEQELWIEINKSRISLKGADNEDSLRGSGLHGMICDEVASFRNWDYTWAEVLRPALSDYQGFAWFISTPQGFNHFYDLYNQQDSNKEWKSFHFTSYTNPYLEKNEIEEAKKQYIEQGMEDAFEQEYLANFRKQQNAFTSKDKLEAMQGFGNNDKKLSAWLELQGVNYIDQAEIIKSWLLGLEKEYEKRNLYVGIDIAKQIDKTIVTVATDRIFNPSVNKIKCIAIDSTGIGDYMPDWFERNSRWYIARIKFTAQQKDALYKNLQQVIQNRLTELPEFDTDESKKFLKEMIDLQQERKGDIIMVNHPEGNYHDDYPDSWALMEWGYSLINGLSKSRSVPEAPKSKFQELLSKTETISNPTQYV